MLPSLLASEGGPSPLVPHTSEVIVGLVAFLLLLYILQKFALPRFEQVFQARRDAIEGGIKRADEAQAKAQQALEQYRAQLAEARTEAAQIRDNARAEGQRIIEEMRVTAQEESARIVQRGEEELATQRQQIVRDLRGEIGALAVKLSERVLGESLADDPARLRTVDRFLDELDGMAESVPAGVGARTAAADAPSAPATPGAQSGPGASPAADAPVVPADGAPAQPPATPGGGATRADRTRTDGPTGGTGDDTGGKAPRRRS